VVLVLLGPADEERPVAVQPGVTGLHDPAPGTPARRADFEVHLLAAATDVGGEATRDRRLSGAVGVVGAIEAEPLRAPARGLGPRDRDRVERRLEQLQIVAVGAVVRQPDRDPARLAQKRTLRPLLALSVGFGPVLSPPSGALLIAPSAASHSQSMPTVLSYSSSP